LLSMASQFGAFIEIEPSSSRPIRPELHRVLTTPEKAVAKTYHSVPLPQSPDIRELDSLEWGAKLNGPSKSDSGAATPTGAQTPRTTNDIEIRTLASPNNEHDGVDVMQSFSSPPMNRFRMVAVSFLNFNNGLSDSAPGALIPYMEK